MKIGDKIFCIKSKLNHNTKGKTYKIFHINNINEILVTTNDWYLGNVYNTTDYKFEDYFVTEKQLRKLKLEKLNDKTQ